jgi:predicted phage terminase large subunit-like protein
MQTADEINRNRIARVMCQESLMFSTRYFFKRRHNRKFVVNEHHETIADVLEEVITGKIKRLIINLPPRYSKTEIAVKNFVAHCLSLNPASMFIHLSGSDDLALDNSEEIKDMVMSEEYTDIFPEVQIKKDSKSKKKWYTTAGGGVYATSAAGQVTGFGAGKVDDEETELDEALGLIGTKEQFAGAVIIDDPIKPEDADSDTKRERVNNRYDSTISSRVNSRNTPIIIIMQRLHPEDLCGYLISKEPDVWTVLSLPAIKEDGTALWPFKQTVDELMRLKARNPLVFERQYMQDPKALEGLVFPESEMKRYKELPPDEADPKDPTKTIQNYFTIAFGDCADEGKDSFAMPIGRVYGNRVYITDAIFDQLNLTIQEGQVQSKVKEHNISDLVIESNSFGAYFSRRIRELMPALQVYGQYAKANKMGRILANAGLIKMYFYFPENPTPTLQRFINQVCKLTKTATKDDDAPDSLSGLAAYLEKMHGLFKHE